MEHVAIMRKSWGLLPKILDGRKTIESRWSVTKCKPWDAVKPGETVYFKNSGEPVSVRAEVEKVVQFADLTSKRVRELLDRYYKDDGLEEADVPAFFERFRDKQYGMFIFLKSPREIEPFEIDKTGFGMMSAWITVDDISKIQR